MIENMYQLQDQLNQEGIFFCFSGPITQKAIVELGDLIKHRLEYAETNASTIIKIFSMVIEQTQNIVHYSAEKLTPSPDNLEDALKVGMLTVGHKGDEYFVTCGNKIRLDDVERLTAKLEIIRKMNKDELKQYYKEQRRLEPDSESKGAGLGFIEMARKATKPIEYHFEVLDRNYAYFTLKTVI
ncbi:MAG: hypothetical protein HQM12_03775 [SAR324 cluster bacterium]|nr:hypothetical protein [SAR324 cluster bacterium]